MRLLRLLWGALLELADSIASVTVVALFALTFLVGPYRIPTGSMIPTLMVGDFILVNQQVFAPAGVWRWLLPYRSPRPGDLVVFHWPVRPRQLLVKRTVAVAGQQLRLHRGRTFIDGVAVAEPWAEFQPENGPSHFRDEFPSLLEADPDVQAAWWAQLRLCCSAGTFQVPPNQIFTLGDNRNDSVDSRYWGTVPVTALVGEPLVVYLSIDATVGKLRRRRALIVR